jgi:protein-tyrosine phosphatase
MIEATEILPGLYQGSFPLKGDALRRAGFTHLVLCAREWQRPSADFQGIGVIHAPLDDNFEYVSRDEAELAVLAARTVRAMMARGGRVLVTCAMGRNRSGLVTALVIARVLRCSGDEAIRFVQSRRAHALSNPVFRELIRRLARGQSPQSVGGGESRA